MTTTTPTSIKPDTIAAVEQLVAALRAARERDLGHPLDADEQEVLGLQVRPLVLGALELDPQAREWLIRSEVENLAQEIINEELAAGRLIDHGDGSYERPAHLRGAGR